MKRYHSIHEYLDEVLADIAHPTDAEIKSAKQAYWKLYYRQYRKDKRKERKEFTLGFSAEILKQINEKRDTLSISQFLYTSVHQALHNTEMPVQDNSILKEIDYKLMEIINLLEEHSETEILIEKIEQLETQFTELFKANKG